MVFEVRALSPDFKTGKFLFFRYFFDDIEFLVASKNDTILVSFWVISQFGLGLWVSTTASRMENH